MEDVSQNFLRFCISASPLDSVCRLCLSDKPDCTSLNKPLHIRAEGLRGSFTAKEILTRLLQIESYDTESLPQNICEPCLDSLLKFFVFWQRCRHAESQLRTQVELLSSRVSDLHSNVVGKRKRSQYDQQNAAILFLKKKNIDYLDYAKTKLSKLDDIKIYLNQNAPNFTKQTSNKAKPIETIRSNAPNKLYMVRDPSLKYECAYCPESFTHIHYLMSHLKLHHHIYDIAECTKCGKKFKTVRLLKLHSKKHREESFKCRICKADFESADAFESHTDEFHTELHYQCPDCNELFENECDVKVHQKNTHKADYEYYCKICGKKFHNYYAVKSHEEGHGGFECNRCSQKFNTGLKLETHLASCLLNDTEIAPKIDSYICDYCGKTLYRKKTLCLHIEHLHLHPKRFKCLSCGKKFSRRSQLTAHTVVHTRKRTEFCTVCGNYFVTKSALTYHMRLHTGERPYACDMCDERFLSASRRMAHFKMKHIGKTELCDVCPKSFFSRYALKTHRMRHFDPSSRLFNSNVSLE